MVNVTENFIQDVLRLINVIVFMIYVCVLFLDLYFIFLSSPKPGLHQAGHWIFVMQCKQVHLQAECAARKGITAMRPSLWQRAR